LREEPVSELWVFGYGSLMWRPGFDHVESQPALLRGAHRSLCVYSVVHRGTEQRPGLVLGLDAGGSCRGIAFRVEAAAVGATLEYLREREQVTMVYREARRAVRLLDGSDRTVETVCFLVDRRHRQYAGRLAIPEQAKLVRAGRGASGGNVEYVANTVRHLDQMGLAEPSLRKLLAALGENPGIAPRTRTA
jgi:cation transport protein ChaC